MGMVVDIKIPPIFHGSAEIHTLTGNKGYKVFFMKGHRPPAICGSVDLAKRLIDVHESDEPSGTEDGPYLKFVRGDGPGVWQVDGIYDSEDVSFLVVCDEDMASVSYAIAAVYPLGTFNIRGIKMLDGPDVEAIQLRYDDWRMRKPDSDGRGDDNCPETPTARDASPASATPPQTEDSGEAASKEPRSAKQNPEVRQTPNTNETPNDRS